MLAYHQVLEAGILRVLHVLPAGEFGGAESQILALAKGLQALGIKVEVATYFDAEFAQKARATGIAVRVFASDGLLHDRQILLTYLKEHPVDVLHTHGVRASFIGRLVGRTVKIPVVTTIHSDLYYDYASTLRRFLFMQMERFTRRYSMRIIAVSNALAHILLARGYDKSRLVVIANGMDTKRADTELRLADQAPVDIKRSLGIQETAWVVFCAARLHPVKRHDILIQAIAALPEVAGRAVHLVLAGDGSERSALEALAKDLAPGRIHFLGARTDVFALLSQADVFALVSTMEGLPIALLEAMYARLPVVTTRVGGMVELVEGTPEDSRQAGLSVPPGDVQALAQAFSVLLSDDGLRRRMGEIGYTRVRDKYSLSHMAQQVADLYTGVVSEEI